MKFTSPQHTPTTLKNKAPDEATGTRIERHRVYLEQDSGDAPITVPLDLVITEHGSIVNVEISALLLVLHPLEPIQKAVKFVYDNYHELCAALPFVATGRLHPESSTESLVSILRSPYFESEEALQKAVRSELSRRGVAFFEAHQEAKGKAGWVYLAKSETGHLKIGLSKTPSERVKHFDTQMPIEVRMMTTFPADNAAQAERELHTLLEDYRHKGEWFVLPPSIVHQLFTIQRFHRGVFYQHYSGRSELSLTTSWTPRLYPFTPQQAEAEV